MAGGRGLILFLWHLMVIPATFVLDLRDKWGGASRGPVCLGLSISSPPPPQSGVEGVRAAEGTGSTHPPSRPPEPIMLSSASVCFTRLPRSLIIFR